MGRLRAALAVMLGLGVAGCGQQPVAVPKGEQNTSQNTTDPAGAGSGDTNPADRPIGNGSDAAFSDKDALHLPFSVAANGRQSAGGCRAAAR